jgi:histone H3/H4
MPMKTRIAPHGAPLRQEKFASSPLFTQGLLANHVARRCSVVEDANHRACLWWIQWQSWQTGGLKTLVDELLQHYPKGEFVNATSIFSHNPFLNDRYLHADVLRKIEKWCLDPESDLETLGFQRLCEYREKWMAERSKQGVQTQIGKKIERVLDYAYEARTLCIIDGDPRLGKTYAAKHYCDASGGLMRFVQIPSATDLASFLRAIAESLGLATNLNLKAQVLHDRIRDSLASGDIGICFDEAHYAWPQGRLRSAVPARVNWIMTVLCNMDIPVVMVTTPQFYTAQAQLEKQTAWSSAQWVGRIGHVEKLPDELPDADLRKVAGYILPEADDQTITALAAYAAESKKHLQSIDAIAKRARWLAHEEGRTTTTTGDIRRALKESVIPSDLKMAAALAASAKPEPRPRRGNLVTHPRTSSAPIAERFSRPVERVPGLVIA